MRNTSFYMLMSVTPKLKTFEYIKDNIWTSIYGWKEKLLSMTGKEILIKSIAQAIPTYAMSCFDLTQSSCKQVRAMICRYRPSNQDKDKMHLASVGYSKTIQVGRRAGFWDLHAFNKAMIAK
jgi:hypothetical protein